MVSVGVNVIVIVVAVVFGLRPLYFIVLAVFAVRLAPLPCVILTLVVSSLVTVIVPAVFDVAVNSFTALYSTEPLVELSVNVELIFVTVTFIVAVDAAA